MLDFKSFNELPQLTDFTRVSGQMGSNPAGVYRHNDTGEDHYIKHQKSNDHALNEVMASKLYQAAGSPVINSDLIHLGDGKLGSFSKMEKIDLMDRHNPDDVRDVQRHFGTHVWLGNWDTVGLSYDNQGRGRDGAMKTIDVGGSLKYRAQGGPKGAAWGDKPSEDKTLKDRSINPEASSIFGRMDPAVEKESYDRVAQVPDNVIRDIVHAHGGDDGMVQTLVKRKNHVASLAETM
jgi:hypothetical protein